MKSNSYLVIKMALLLALLSGPYLKKNPQRDPSSLRELNDLVLSSYVLEDNKQIILLGVQCHSDKVACDDWNDLGFDSIKGNQSFARPKFLFLKNDQYIEQVFTFEYGITKKKSVLSAMESSDLALLRYIKLPSRISARLPQLLVDPLLVTKDRRVLSTFEHLNTVLQFTPLSGASRTIAEGITYFEDKKFYQASYLNRLIEMALIDESFPELLETFGDHELKELGAALRLRFRGSSHDVVSSFGSKRKYRAEYYEDVIRYRTENQSINMSKLATRASEEGLILVPYSRDMAILYYDPAIEYRQEEYRDLLLNTSLDKNSDKYNELFESEEKIIPLGVFLLSDSDQPTKTIDFESPQILLKKENFKRVLDYALTIGMSFIDNSALSIAVKVGYFGGKLHYKKSGKIFSSSMLESESHFEALMDSGAINIDSKEVSKEIFSFYLEELNLKDDEYGYYTNLLKSENEEKINQGLQDLLKLYQTSQSSKRFSHGLKEAYKANNRLTGWLSLKKWISTQKEKDSMVSFLQTRQELRQKIVKKEELEEKKAAEKKEKRQNSKIYQFFSHWFQKIFGNETDSNNKEAKFRRGPSSLQSDAAVVLMIDGLRPDRFHEAYQKGLIPNLGKYFIDRGVEFNSFTTRSLTLPSWSSILTGVDQDYHGLKSNGPMSRALASPQNNYIDPRADILNVAFNSKKNNRAYDHLKESGRKWLPDYFQEGEVHTNYMPVNNAPFYDLGILFKTVLEDTKKLLFGNFNGSIALDRVSAVETAEKMKKDPGKTKLVLNWLTCVDVFSHHNNRALDICYRELDKSFKIILDQMKLDPVMKDAHMFIISDHGHIGGDESQHSHYKLGPKGSYYNNTALNLTTLFAGDYRGYTHFSFEPFVMQSPYPDNDLKFLNEFQIHPSKYRYTDSKKNQGANKAEKKHNVLIDYSGDAMAQVYFKHPENEWNQKLSFYDLKNLHGRNIMEDILDVKVRNTVNSDPHIRKALNSINNGHPVWMIAQALTSCSPGDFNNILSEDLPDLARSPVLIKGRDSDYGVVLVKQKKNELLYRYVLLSEFDQDQDGKCTGIVSVTPKDILVDYHSSMNNEWLNKEELLSKFMNHDYPTAMITLVGTLTLSNDLKEHKNRKQEIPDIILYAHKGFNFNSSYTTESDHGGLTRQETRHSFFYAQLGRRHSEKTKENVFKKPALSYYLTPFLLEATGRDRDDQDFKTVPYMSDFFNSDNSFNN